MGNRGFDDDVQFFHRQTLVVPLAEIEGRSSDEGQQESEAVVADDCVRAHIAITSHRRGEVALFILSLESAVIVRSEASDVRGKGFCLRERRESRTVSA